MVAGWRLPTILKEAEAGVEEHNRLDKMDASDPLDLHLFPRIWKNNFHFGRLQLQ